MAYSLRQWDTDACATKSGGVSSAIRTVCALEKAVNRVGK
jgi:hypothetical protein